MATVIKFKVDGMEFNVQSLNYGLNSFADVSNPTQEIDFQPVSVSEFSFSILPPTKDDGSNLVQWLTEHEVKGSASFSINKQKTTEKPREIALEDVCLTSYSESIDENNTSISLSLVARKVDFDGVALNLSENR